MNEEQFIWPKDSSYEYYGRKNATKEYFSDYYYSKVKKEDAAYLIMLKPNSEYFHFYSLITGKPYGEDDPKIMRRSYYKMWKKINVKPSKKKIG